MADYLTQTGTGTGSPTAAWASLPTASSSIGGVVTTPIVVSQGGTGLTTLTNHAVLLGASASVMGAATVGTTGRVLTDQGASADPIFSSTGIKLDTFSQVVTVDTPSAGAVTCNLATSNAHSITLAASTLITLTNPATSRRQSAILYIIQGGSGSYTPTFTPAVAWGTAGTPVWSTTVGKVDIVVLDWDGTSYRGAVVGLGY